MHTITITIQGKRDTVRSSYRRSDSFCTFFKSCQFTYVKYCFGCSTFLLVTARDGVMSDEGPTLLFEDACYFSKNRIEGAVHLKKQLKKSILRTWYIT